MRDIPDFSLPGFTVFIVYLLIILSIQRSLLIVFINTPQILHF